MSALRAAFAEVAGLFVEDAGFALAIAVWLAAAGVASALTIGDPSVRAVAFFVGLAVVLLASVARAARPRQ